MEGAPPSAWRVARAILPLPFTATVVVPALILLGGSDAWGWSSSGRVVAGVTGAALIAAGLSVFIATVRLFDAAPGLATRFLPLWMRDAQRRQRRWKRRIESGQGP